MILQQLPPSLQETVSDSRGRFTFTSYRDTSRGYYLSAESRDGKLRGTCVVPPDTAQADFTLHPVSEARGELEITMKGRYQGLPVQVRVNEAPRDSFVLAAGRELTIDELDAGTWRLDVRWHERYLRQSELVVIEGDAATELAVILPKGALHGQSEDARLRVGR